jgi:hypothetical protein
MLRSLKLLERPCGIERSFASLWCKTQNGSGGVLQLVARSSTCARSDQSGCSDVFVRSDLLRPQWGMHRSRPARAALGSRRAAAEAMTAAV